MTRYFTEDHEWIEVDGDSATVGITHYAQSQLGDIVFAEVPAAGATLKKGGDAAVVESVKAASDVYAPVSGTVIEGNDKDRSRYTGNRRKIFLRRFLDSYLRDQP